MHAPEQQDGDATEWMTGPKAGLVQFVVVLMLVALTAGVAIGEYLRTGSIPLTVLDGLSCALLLGYLGKLTIGAHHIW